MHGDQLPDSNAIDSLHIENAMKKIALITSASSLAIDFDMPLLIPAFRSIGLDVDVCDWENHAIDWSIYDAAVLRSPWNYVDSLPKFLNWCDGVEKQTTLLNPAVVARWNLDKYYLADIQARGVPIVPTQFVEPGQEPDRAMQSFLDMHPQANEVVIKPTVGAYSKDVQRYARTRLTDAAKYIESLLGLGHHVILQPYLDSIDSHGETDLTFFNGAYSHAIRKNAMLMADGTVNVPTQDLRSSREADQDEQRIASRALATAAECLKLTRPLVYGRVDLIRGTDGQPVVLELEICEPSLNLPFTEHGADRFAMAISDRLAC